MKALFVRLSEVEDQVPIGALFDFAQVDISFQKYWKKKFVNSWLLKKGTKKPPIFRKAVLFFYSEITFPFLS